MFEGARVEVEVLAESDVLRRERLTRSLFAELAAVDGLDVQFAPSGGAADSEAKGTEVVADASLWVFLAATVQAGARVLLAAIQAWAERDKHRVVQVTMGERTIEIPAEPTQGQERIVEEFLRGGER
jgi:hypothetical protein